MNTWSRVNLLLAALAAVLLALDLWPTGGDGGRGLTELNGDDVTRLRIERAERLALELVRTAGGWQLQHPQTAPAQMRRVEQLLAIARAPVQHSFPADRDLARYGLERPQAVLQLDRVRLLFGDRDPSQRSRYVLAGNEVRVIDDLYFHLLTLPATHFAED